MMRTKYATLNRSSHARLLQIISALLAMLILFLGILSPIANADENENADEIAKDYIGEDSFAATFNRAQNDSRSTASINSFAYAINRLMGVSYLNNVSSGTAAKGLPSPSDLRPNPGMLCAVNHKYAGTPLYHNCDIPNFTTEALQTVFELFSPQGVRGAAKSQNKLWTPEFGLPSTIPNKKVPAVIDDSTPYKYTALEVFGYSNLKYTRYVGEWDNIKTMNQARMMTNFSGSDYMRLGWNSMVNGIGAAFGNVSSKTSEGWEKGGLFGAIGGFYTGIVSAPAASALGVFHSILDSSDLNVVNTDAWYRTVYGSNSYSIRTKTTSEQAKEIIKAADDYLRSSNPEMVPKDPVLADLLTAAPSSRINYEGVTMTWGEWYNNPANPYNKKYVDFFRENISVETDSCKAPKKNASPEEIDNFIECAPGVIREVADKDYEDRSNKSFLEWLTGKSKADAYRDWYIENNPPNFNAPWNMYVCVSEAGVAINDGNLVNAFTKDGKYNCNSPARVPIQNGLFGNGYPHGETPQNDTRHFSNISTNILVDFLDLDKFPNELGNFFISVSSFFTRISNTVLNLAFSPIFEELGVNDIVVSLMESFRDGIFAPLLAMAVAAGALYVLWQTGTKRTYAEQFKNLILIVGTSFLGVIMLYAPQKMFFWTEEIPSMIETAIMGTIFEAGHEADSKLCTATGTSTSHKGTDLEGETLRLDPTSAVRQMMCENWQVYVYAPYVYGQWGTSIETLNASSSSAPSKMNNTNTAQVGNAIVKLGPGESGTIRNWAVYQTRVMTAGSATTADGNARIGQTDANIYKIVDLQAGPNNGEGTDSSYFSWWSGGSPVGRVTVSFISAISSIAGMIVVIAYSLQLLELKLITTLMLVIMPFMFLMGVIPGQGRMKLKKYFVTLGVLITQRILLVAMLALMMRVLLSLALASTGMIMLAIVSISVPIVFMLYRKEILGLVEQTANSAGGAFNTPRARELASSASSVVPVSARNQISTQRAALFGGLTGAAAGVVAGVVVREKDEEGETTGTKVVKGGNAIVEGFKIGAGEQSQFRRNRNRRAGFGATEKYTQSKAGAKEDLTREFNQDNKKNLEEMSKDILEEINKARTSAKEDALPKETKISYFDLFANKNTKKQAEAMLRAKQRIEELDKEEKRVSAQSSTTGVGNGLINTPEQISQLQTILKERKKAEADYEYYTKEITSKLLKGNPELLAPIDKSTPSSGTKGA